MHGATSAPGPDTSEECRAKRTGAQIGRVVFVDGRGPVALPVNYGMLDGDVVFRTAAASSLLASTHLDRVGFEVDEIDERRHEGWSVLAAGIRGSSPTMTELRSLQRLGITPWAKGARTQYVRITVRTIAGRRLRRRRRLSTGPTAQ